MPETCIMFGQHGARITIQEKEVPHFAIDVDSEKKEVSCWIASEEGKVFSVEWLGVDVDYPSACYLHLDGIFIGRKRRKSRNAELIKYQHTSVSESSKVPFLFSKLLITDDDTYLDTPSHSIGEIKFVINRTTVPKVVQRDQRMNYLSPPQKVHERSKKAIAHQVNFGSEIPAQKKAKYSFKNLETLVTFIFKYRPFEMLRANDIVPRNPKLLESQEHSHDIPSISEMSSEKSECSRLKREAESAAESDDEDSMRERALLAELEKIRKGKQLKDKHPKKKVKKEEKPCFTPGEIIDLT